MNVLLPSHGVYIPAKYILDTYRTILLHLEQQQTQVFLSFQNGQWKGVKIIEFRNAAKKLLQQLKIKLSCRELDVKEESLQIWIAYFRHENDICFC